MKKQLASPAFFLQNPHRIILYAEKNYKKLLSCMALLLGLGLETVRAQEIDTCFEVTLPASCSVIPYNTDASPCELYGSQTADVTIPANTKSSALSSSTFTNKKIMVQGDFIINSPTTFNNCKVQIAPGAIIKTEGSQGKLTITNQSRLYACDGLWKGLQVNAAGVVRISFSYISDAERAVHLVNGYNAAESKIYNTRFFRNLYGIFAFQLGTTIISFNTFFGNVFDGSRAYTYPGNVEIVPVNALYLYRATGYFGFPSYKNEVKNYPTGIQISPKSNITLANFKIFDMYRIGNSNPIGISVDNASLHLTGDLSTNGCEIFDCCGFGVFAKNSNLDIKGAQFYGITNTHIRSEDNVQKQIIIQQNTFLQVDGSCIFIERGSHLTPQTVNFIQDNTFTMEDSRGIEIVDDATGGAKDIFRIANNTATVTNGRFFVLVKGSEIDNGSESLNFQIENNTMTYNGTALGSFDWPIAFQNCDGDLLSLSNRIVANTLLSENDVDNALCAVHLERSRFSYVCANTIKGAFRAFHIFGNNDQSYFASNTIRDNQLGLHIQGFYTNSGTCISIDPGVLGEQKRTGNYWELIQYANGINWDCNAFPGQFAALCEDDPSLSIFRIENNDTHLFPPDIYPTFGWFFLEPGQTNYCGGLLLPSRSPSEFDLAVASNQSGLFSDIPSRWEAELALLTMAEKAPSLLNNSVIQNFYSTHQGLYTSQWAFSRAELAFGQAATVPSGYYQNVENIHQQRTALFDSLNVLVQNTDTVNWLTKNTLIVSLMQDVIDTDSLLLLETAILDSLRMPGLQNALTMVQNLSESTLYEQYRKIIDIWYVRKEMGDTLDNATLDTLRYIAAQALASGGYAVREAQRWLPYCEQAVYLALNHDAHTEEENSRDKKGMNMQRTSGISIAPNPTRDHVTVTSQVPITFSWILVNTTGNTSGSGNVIQPVQQQTIRLENLAAGMYWLQITLQDKTQVIPIIKVD